MPLAPVTEIPGNGRLLIKSEPGVDDSFICPCQMFFDGADADALIGSNGGACDALYAKSVEYDPGAFGQPIKHALEKRELFLSDQSGLRARLLIQLRWVAAMDIDPGLVAPFPARSRPALQKKMVVRHLVEIRAWLSDALYSIARKLEREVLNDVFRLIGTGAALDQESKQRGTQFHQGFQQPAVRLNRDYTPPRSIRPD